MRNGKLNYTVVGVFVLGMLGTAIATVAALKGPSGRYDRYVVLFDNVADIKFGTQVRYEGFPVGQVEDIQAVAAGGAEPFRLEISVREGWKIPADSVASIGSSSFLGAKTLEIRRGPSETLLRPGARIASAPPADMFAAMSAIAGEFGDLSRNSLRPLVERMARLAESADKLVANDLGVLLGSLNVLAANLEKNVPQIAGRLLTFTDRLNKTLSDGNVEGVEHVVANVEQVSRDFVAMSADLQGTLGQVDAVVARLERIVANNEGKVDAALDDTRYVLRSMARNIDTINHNLAGTARNMNEFSRLIRQNPGLLLNGAPREDISDYASPASSGRGDGR